MHGMQSNWNTRAHWFLKQEHLADNVEWPKGAALQTFAFVLSFSILFTVYLGMLLPKLPAISALLRRHSRTIDDKESARPLRLQLAMDYIIFATTAIVLSLLVHAFFQRDFAGQGLTHCWGRHLFHDSASSEIGKIMCGFFSSILVLSFLDPLLLRRVIHEDYPLPQPKLLGSAAFAILAGFGGFAGVGGVCVFLFADLTQSLLPPDPTAMVLVMVLCLVLAQNYQRMFDGPFLVIACLLSMACEMGFSASAAYIRVVVYALLLSLIANIQFVSPEVPIWRRGWYRNKPSTKITGILSVVLVLLLSYKVVSSPEVTSLWLEEPASDLLGGHGVLAECERGIVTIQEQPQHASSLDAHRQAVTSPPVSAQDTFVAIREKIVTFMWTLMVDEFNLWCS